MPKFCTTKFWIRTDAPLIALAKRLQKVGVISNFEYDIENVYEWFVAKPTEYDVELNVSRLHHDSNVPKSEPLNFMLITTRITDSQSQLTEWTNNIADAICRALEETVEIGEIEHLGDDNYRYYPSKVISPD